MRDLRILGNREYEDVCYLYDSNAVDGNVLLRDAQPIGRFRKRDIKPFQWQRPNINGEISSDSEYIGVIETLDHVEQVKPDMFVVDQNGDLFIVVAPVIKIDSSGFGRRKANATQLTLRGLIY